jgi:hypothetical protein
MIFRPKGETSYLYDSVYLNNECIKVVSSTKYLGHYLASDLSDDLDIKRQCRQLYAQGNSLIRKFHMCSVEVKLFLFQSYCSPMYTAHLWWSYSKVSIRKLQIAYHTVFKILLGFSKYDSNSLLCTVFHTRSCSAAIRNYVYKFMCRLATSPNDIIKNIALTSLAFTSRIRNHWIQLLYVGASP